MGKRNRFLNLKYLTNTFAIKAKALVLKIKRGPYPFTYFKEQPTAKIDLKYKLNYQSYYHSLSYMNFEKAQEFHSGNRSVTQCLIITLIYHNECIKDTSLDKNYLIELASSLKEKATITESEMIFYIDESYSRFDLMGKYYSGIIQGKAASLFLRCFLQTNDEKYKLWAKKCLTSCWKLTTEGGVLVALPNNHFWIEEYPSPKPSMVLNGFLFYLIGLAEYLSCENDEKLKSQFELCLSSAIVWMPNYRLKNGLLYSMYRWDLSNVHYTGIMKYQFEHLFKLTGNSIFREYAEFNDRLTDWKVFDWII